jgi:NACHT domain
MTAIDPSDFDEVERNCRLRFPGARVERLEGDPPCLLVSPSEEAELTHVKVLIGVAAEPDAQEVKQFLGRVEKIRGRPFDVSQPLILELLCLGHGPDLKARLSARQQGVWLFKYQASHFRDRGPLAPRRPVDLTDYVERQTRKLEQNSPRYAPRRYLSQDFQILEAGGGSEVHPDLLERLLEWMSSEQLRFVLLLSDAGKGKTFVLRELARQLPEKMKDLQPVLVKLTARQHLSNVPELVRVHLLDDAEDVELTHEDFYSLLHQGQIVLLLDGFDELTDHNTFETAHQELEHLVRLAEGRAKIIVAARAQHFVDDSGLRAILNGAAEDLRRGSRTVAIQDFSAERVWEILGTVLGDGGPQVWRSQLAAAPWLAKLLGSPRMLGLVVAETEEPHGADRTGPLLRDGTCGRPRALLEWLVAGWLEVEDTRFGTTPMKPALTKGEHLWALTELACRTWLGGDSSALVNKVEETDLMRACREVLTARTFNMTLTTHMFGAAQPTAIEGLSARDANTVKEMAHDLAGVLIVREQDTWRFLQESIVEYLVADLIRTQPPAAPVVHRARGRGGSPGHGHHGSSLASDGLLRVRKLTELMADVVCDGPAEGVRSWADSALKSEKNEIARANATLILSRLGAAGPH